MGVSSLNTALSGLRVAGQQIDVISGNVSNVGTPGFSRKILPQATQSVNGITVGVRADTIIRQVDINLERDLWTQVSRVGLYDVQSEYLSRVEDFHGPPDAELSISAEVARLRDGFSELTDSPESSFLQTRVVDQAIDTANQINELADLITTLRNDAQNEIENTVERVNGLLQQIAELNDQVESQRSSGRSSALTEDTRSQSIQELAELIDISFFQRGDGVLVVQTNEGVELTSDRAQTLTFRPSPLGPQNLYPDSSVAGVFVGDPFAGPGAVDITGREPGGRLGGLLELRDEIFPRQTAQLDELAHKTAQRFESQGLRLFTNDAGFVPADTAPTPAQSGPPPVPATPVEYVGFSSIIQVNQDILNDHSLVQSGTSGAIIPSGSNAIIQRVLDNTFGSIDHQQAIGNLDLRVSANAPPNNTLQNFLGLVSENQLTGSEDLSSTQYSSLSALLTAGGEVFDDGFNQFDTLTITFDDPDIGGGPYDIELDLSAIAALPTSGSAGQDIINAISADPDFAGAAADFGASVSLDVNGRLVIDGRSDVTISAGGTDPISQNGIAFLGIGFGTFEATDPSFEVGVGSDALTRITIEPSDDENTLLAKLSAVPGLAVDDITISTDGFLRLRPGNDFNDPDFGGDITIIAGPDSTSGAGANAVFGAGTIPDGINSVSALFGSFNAGPPAQNQGAVTNVEYGSETNGLFAPPAPTTAFRSDFLGQNADISSGISSATSLADFAQRIVNQHAQELILIEERRADESTLGTILNDQLVNESGVNIDEELGRLIVVQTAYSASARVISAVEEIFTELLNAVG